MRNKVIDLLDQTIEELDKEKIDGILEIPPKDDMGDFAFPCFQLAKVFRKAPNMIATEIAEKIPASEDVSKVEAMGPYVNFFLNKENYVKEVLAKVDGTYGAQKAFFSIFFEEAQVKKSPSEADNACLRCPKTSGQEPECLLKFCPRRLFEQNPKYLLSNPQDSSQR